MTPAALPLRILPPVLCRGPLPPGPAPAAPPTRALPPVPPIFAGILAAQLINYGAQDLTWGWRLSLGLAGVPAVLLFIGGLVLPETPNSLAERGRTAEAKAVLQRLRGTQDVEVEMADIVTGGCSEGWRWLLVDAALVCFRALHASPSLRGPLRFQVLRASPPLVLLQPRSRPTKSACGSRGARWPPASTRPC